MSRPIEDYAFIGNTLTAALVGRDGCMDWLCAPRFDSPACLAGMLGTPSNGHWTIRPRGASGAGTRRYLGDTLILETVFETAEGAVELVDFMPLPRDENVVDVVRIVRGRSGRVPMCSQAVFRCDYGSIAPWLLRHDSGFSAIAGPLALHVYAPVPLHPEERGHGCDFTVAPGESLAFVLTASLSHRPEPPRIDPHAALDRTERWWRKWAQSCRVDGPWREAVMRSMIVLKALTYSPTGGMVAAATTSLPETLGGVRNWDYRYCWLRDTALVLRALMRTGTTAEAYAWREWLHRAAAGDPAGMHIMYGLAGERRLEEYELPGLPGYAGSRPVRIGNAAYVQRQMDVYGEVMEAFECGREEGLESTEDSWRLQCAIMDFLEHNWQLPGTGLWEERSGERHYTSSKIMLWVAADRAISAVERYGLSGPVDRWKRLRAKIHEDVCRHGFSSRRNAFVQTYGAPALDASLLRIPELGFLPADDPRVRATVDAIQRDLMVDGFVLRYRTSDVDDGLPDGESCFLACSLWLADALILLGRRDEACEMFERVLRIRNDLGLLSEQYDPHGRRLLGNFPQAFSHLALCNTARMLSAAPDGRGSPRD